MTDLKPHQQRVVDEKAALDENLGKLLTFHSTTVFSALDDAEQNRLVRQSVAMDDYSKILGERIAAFTND